MAPWGENLDIRKGRGCTINSIFSKSFFTPSDELEALKKFIYLTIKSKGKLQQITQSQN